MRSEHYLFHVPGIAPKGLRAVEDALMPPGSLLTLQR